MVIEMSDYICMWKSSAEVFYSFVLPNYLVYVIFETLRIFLLNWEDLWNEASVYFDMKLEWWNGVSSIMFSLIHEFFFLILVESNSFIFAGLKHSMEREILILQVLRNALMT